MAYDIARRKTSPRNWSRGSGQNIGTVGSASLGGEGFSKKLVVGALVGAAGAIGYLAWRGHSRRPVPTHRHPMAKRIFIERGPGGALVPRY